MSIQSKQHYYRKYLQSSEGVYRSHWFSKLSNTLMTEGKKKTVLREAEKVLILNKIQFGHMPLVFYLEALDLIKPTFNIQSITSRGRKKEFPVFLERSKQLRLAVQWVAKLVRLRKERGLHHRVYNELLDIHSHRRHLLIKRRDDLFLSAVENKFNLRYSF